MKKIALGLLIGFFLVSAASAYLVTLQAPDRIYAGETLTVTIAGTVPAGTTTDIVLYRAAYSKREVARETFTFQEEPLTLSFSTGGYPAGYYQLELIDPTGDTFGGSSTVRKMVEIVNRTTDLTITSQKTQQFDGTLDLAGRVKDLEDRGVRITVENGNGIVYGPAFIPTDSDGKFSEEVAIDEAGAYRVEFTDYKGYITTVVFIVYPVGGETPLPTTEIPTPVTTTISVQPTDTVPPTTTPATPLPAALAMLAIAFAFVKRG